LAPREAVLWLPRRSTGSARAIFLQQVLASGYRLSDFFLHEQVSP
jgi:hypothetical protein